MTASVRTFASFLLIALLAALGMLCELTGQTVYRAGSATGRALMNAGQRIQDCAIELMGAFD